MNRLSVTDHAVVRYLERVLNLDMDKIRDDIRAQAHTGHPVCVPPIGGGLAIMGPARKAAVIVRENIVVTVLGAREIRRARWMRTVEAAE